MKPKIFIIDDIAEYRELLKHHVTTRWPDAVVREYDPQFSGRLPEKFSGAGNDLVLLAHPAAGTDALEWLHQFRRVPGFPPVVFIGDGDERQVVAAIKAGAADYISRSRLNHSRLIGILEGVLEAAGVPPVTPSPFGADVRGEADLPCLRGYELERRIAVSDISAVYLATQLEYDRKVVLKILRQVPDAGSESAFDRFLQEYELIANVRHPNIVRIFDLGVADDHAYIAMEYCARGSLKRRVRKGLSKERAFRYMRQIASALGELHGIGILHRDMKPTNVMFRDDDTLVLIDFGLAKQAQLRTEITGTGEIFGTPYYMSPEQGHAGDVDHRGDIYSLGVMFYEMLTCSKPFEGETAMGVIIQHNQAPVPRLPSDCAEFQDAIDRMMAKKPADRFQSTEELLAWQPESADAPVA